MPYIHRLISNFAQILVYFGLHICKEFLKHSYLYKRQGTFSDEFRFPKLLSNIIVLTNSFVRNMSFDTMLSFYWITLYYLTSLDNLVEIHTSCSPNAGVKISLYRPMLGVNYVSL